MNLEPLTVNCLGKKHGSLVGSASKDAVLPPRKKKKRRTPRWPEAREAVLQRLALHQNEAVAFQQATAVGEAMAMHLQGSILGYQIDLNPESLRMCR